MADVSRFLLRWMARIGWRGALCGFCGRRLHRVGGVWFCEGAGRDVDGRPLIEVGAARD